MDFLRNYFVVLLALILVFVLNISFTLGDSRIEAVYDFGNYKVLKAKDLRLVLECNVTDHSSSSSNHVIKWLKEETELKPVSEVHKQIEIEGGKITFKRPNWDDVGSYTCALYGPNGTKQLDSANINVIAKPYVKISPNELTFVEGEELKIECTILGRPTPTIIWQFGNETYDESNSNPGRVKILSAVSKEDANILKSYFVIERAQMSDRGTYSCTAHNAADGDPGDREISKATCFVRIKDKYAALWPFLGICVEVVVLCTVIFIYEKKRNKAELEESDTDQSPEHDDEDFTSTKKQPEQVIPLRGSRFSSTLPSSFVEKSSPASTFKFSGASFSSAFRQTSDIPQNIKDEEDLEVDKVIKELEFEVATSSTDKCIELSAACPIIQSPFPIKKSALKISSVVKDDGEKDRVKKEVKFENVALSTLQSKQIPESSPTLSLPHPVDVPTSNSSGKTLPIMEKNQFGKENN